MKAFIFGCILFASAAIFNALSDTAYHHPEKFEKCEWCKHDYMRKYEIERPFVRRYVGLFLDGFHVFKMLMVFCLCGSATAFARSQWMSKWWHYAVLFVALGTIGWNSVFSLFYDVIL